MIYYKIKATTYPPNNTILINVLHGVRLQQVVFLVDTVSMVLFLIRKVLLYFATMTIIFLLTWGS